MKGTKAFQLKIVIKNSKPPIWRRVIVPAGITFSQLSMILNKVMGWCGYHAFEFEFYHQEIRLIEEAEDLDIGYGPYDYIEASTTYIREYLEENEWFTYTYDLGDDWQHRVTIEKIIDDYEYDYPQVIKYKGDCPVEDCGGIWGYYDCLEIISDESNPEYEDRLNWMKSQGYPCTYDMAAVNEELKDAYFYKWGKGETRCQADIYKAHYDGEYGLNATRKDKNKNVMVNQSGKHKMEESAELLMRAIREKMAWEENLKVTSLTEIFDDYDRADLIEIAESKGLKGISNYSKSSLIKKLTAHMLKPEELKAHLVCLNDVEMASFERAAYTQGLYEVKPDDLFDKLQDSAYLGVLSDGFSIMVPRDVVALYNSFKGREFDAERRKTGYIAACLDIVGLLYGVIPLRVFKKLVDKNTELSMTEAEVRAAIERMPACMHDCILVGDTIYNMNRYPDDKGLLKEQGDIEFYIPSRDEIIDLAIKGCNTSTKEARALRQYLVKKMHLPQEMAESVCAIVQIHIIEGCGINEIIPLFEQIGIEFENANQLDAFSKYFVDLWNSTRMITNRGFTPKEKELMNGPEGRDLTVKSNVVNFQEARSKKVYPNDLCPCGSGKKYKNCCKNK